MPERFSSVKLVKASTGELFDIEFAQRLNDSSWVKPATAEMSDTELPPSRSFVSLVKFARGEISNIELLLRFSNDRFVRPAKAEMSDMLLLSSPKRLSLVKPARGEMSDIELPLTHSAVRLVKPAKAEISEITLLAANPRCVRWLSPPQARCLIPSFSKNPDMLDWLHVPTRSDCEPPPPVLQGVQSCHL